jgi:hypothetical protein
MQNLDFKKGKRHERSGTIWEEVGRGNKQE